MDEVRPRQYGQVAPVYDALMSGVPHAAWLARIERAARVRERSPQSALDIACGTGLVSEILYERGYRPVVGVDIAPAMVDVARLKAHARGFPIEYVAQDAAALDLNGRTFDLVISLFDSLNYILDPERLRAAFHRMFAHTTPGGGLLAFDLNSLYALSHDLFSQSNLSGPVRHDWQAHWSRETRLCRVEMDFWVRDRETGQDRHFTETHLQRAYTIPEVTDWLSDAGFSNIEVFGNYGTRPPTATSDRLLFVAERL